VFIVSCLVVDCWCGGGSVGVFVVVDAVLLTTFFSSLKQLNLRFTGQRTTTTRQ
jgi:protein tyrosine phosphatase